MPVSLIAKSIACLFAMLVTGVSVGHAQDSTIRVELKLKSGGRVDGLVVDHNDDAIVVVHDTTPYVFAWQEIETPSAYRTKRDLLAHRRAGVAGNAAARSASAKLRSLTAEDHLQLGIFALSRGRRDLASTAFRSAKRLNGDYAERCRAAWDEFDLQEDRPLQDTHPLDKERSATPEPEKTYPGLAQRTRAALERSLTTKRSSPPDPALRGQILDLYRSFGDEVRRAIAPDLVLIETDHFLVFTDWDARRRQRLATWCEQMYEALCRRFNLTEDAPVFLAKCPVFCWRTRARFLRFAREFDGYDGSHAIGYTRSMPETGHVHLALLRYGHGDDDLNLFAATLVHEGTHAFVHRLYSPVLIPHWVNEGLAEAVAESVLGERCFAGEKAKLLGEQYVRYDWPMRRMLLDAGPIAMHDYPLAHSVVAWMEARDGDAFVAFIKALKQHQPVAEALAGVYDGMTILELEREWRSGVDTAGRHDDHR